MSIFDNTFFRMFGLVLIVIIPIIIISFVVGRFSVKKFYRYIPSILVFILGIGVFIYSKTITESMLDLAYAVMGMILVTSSVLSAIVIFIIDLITSKKTKL